jgi:hypothetical protein
MLVTLRDVMTERAKDVVAGVARRDSGDVVVTHVPTGLHEYDSVFGGLELGVLT